MGNDAGLFHKDAPKLSKKEDIAIEHSMGRHQHFLLRKNKPIVTTAVGVPKSQRKVEPAKDADQ